MKIFLLILTLTSFNSFATEYMGKGKYITNTSSEPCSEVYFSMTRTNTQLTIDDGYYDCKNINGIFLARDFEIKADGTLWENNQQMGTISGDKITLKNQTPGYELFINKYQGDLIVVESYIINNTQKILTSILQAQ